MPNSNVPQHPARQQQAPQQGLAPAQNPYHNPNPALAGKDAQLKQAQTAQAQAQAQKAAMEAQVLRQGLTPQVAPEQVHAQQLAEGLLAGQPLPEGLHPAIAEAAMGMAQAKEQQAAQQYNQAQQGLGGL